VNMAITQFKNEFDRDIFNLDTCDANGLDLWGRLLGVQRPVLPTGIANDEQYRLLLKSRISVLIWDGSSFGLTKIIKNLFPDAVFRVIDCPYDENNEMQYMTVKIEFANGLTSEQIAILSMGYFDEGSQEYVYTFLPRPAGVLYDLQFSTDWTRTLGFEGMTETTNMGGTYNNAAGDTEGTTGIENPDGGVFYK
ncbi:MAG: DUF2612 domain-containing protein, partial [Bacteroidales bacterium]|nr:DUF2612 domain-containing protein [Bacteroidales bacterium]